MCAYPTDQTNQTARWSHIQAIIDVLQGTTADRIQIIQYNNSSYYAGDFRNLDTTNSYGLRVRDASNNNLLLAYKNNLALGASAATDALAINCNISGKVYIGDSANADMTAGLTINQGANDDQILAFKSSDVAHGITTVVETDTFGSFSKLAGANGGMLMRGFLDTGTNGIQLQSFSPTDDTTKSTAGTGAIELRVYKTDGTGHQDAGTDANLVVIGNRSTTRLIVDAEGHIHSIGASATDMLGNGKWFLNDTTNANVTLGVTLNQGANDDQILAFKSSDVAHGVTSLAETDTYGAFKKTASTGGLTIYGLSGSTTAADLFGVVTTATTTKADTSAGAVRINGVLASGANQASLGANGNILVVADNLTTRFILDSDGDSHQDVGTQWTNFHGHDDIALLNTLSAHLTRQEDPLRGQFANWLDQSREPLEKMKLVTFNENGHHFVNWSRMHMLVIGAVLQQAEKIGRLQEEFAALKLSLPAGAGAALP